MIEYKFKKAINEGRILCGMSISVSVPSFLEIIGYSGFDFVYIDTEHSTISLESLSNIIVASTLSGMSTLVRVPDNDPTSVRKALEVGAEGVIIPHVNTREDAERAVSNARFPPEGIRGFGGLVRSNNFNMPPLSMHEYTKCSNEGVSVVVQIEDQQAIQNIGEILDVKGIDAIFLGPSDLSLSLGIPGQFQNPKFILAIDKVLAAAKKKSIPAMCTVSYVAHPITVENIKTLVENGLSLLLFGSVEGAIRQACLDTMENLVKKIR